MRTITYRQAVTEALATEMRNDDSIVFFGEDVAKAGGVFKVTPGIYEEFGELRVRDTPISEQAIIGTALGAAITGLRPVAELMFADFIPVAMDQIVNQVAKYRFMSGGQFTVPFDHPRIPRRWRRLWHAAFAVCGILADEFPRFEGGGALHASEHVWLVARCHPR